MAILTDPESEATGYPSPVPLSVIDTVDLLTNLERRTQRLEAWKADEDNMTRRMQSVVSQETEWLQLNRKHVLNVAWTVMTHVDGSPPNDSEN